MARTVCARERKCWRARLGKVAAQRALGITADLVAATAARQVRVRKPAQVDKDRGATNTRSSSEP